MISIRSGKMQSNNKNRASFLIISMLLFVFPTEAHRSQDKTSRKNYYNILGIKKRANQREVKLAYRKLALQYHPDKNDDKRQAENMFFLATQAYRILIDEDKRKIYDKYGNEGIELWELGEDDFQNKWWMHPRFGWAYRLTKKICEWRYKAYIALCRFQTSLATRKTWWREKFRMFKEAQREAKQLRLQHLQP